MCCYFHILPKNNMRIFCAVNVLRMHVLFVCKVCQYAHFAYSSHLACSSFSAEAAFPDWATNCGNLLAICQLQNRPCDLTKINYFCKTKDNSVTAFHTTNDISVWIYSI